MFENLKIEDVADVTKLAGFEFSKYIKYNDTGEIIALRAINIRNNTLDLSDIKRIDKNVSENLQRSKLFKNDIILTYTGNGYGAVTIIDEDNKYHLAPNICKITPKNINPYYLFKYITTSTFQQEISNNIGGSGQPTIPMKTIRVLPIKVPSRKIQDKIVKVLYDIDKKIKLNNEINNNLYELSVQLLKQYLEDDSLEEINVNELLNVFTGKKNANETSPTGKYKFFSCAPDSLLSDTYIFDGPAIIVAGNGAYTGRTRFYDGKFELYQRTYGLTLKDEVNSNNIYGLYVYMKEFFEKEKMGGTHGSAIPYIVLGDLTNYKLKYNKIKFDKFCESIKNNIINIQKNQEQNETLEQLRDTLLPKLMNGEIDLNNIEI